MKKIFTVLILLVLVSNAYAQAPGWLWAISSNGGYYEDGGGLGFDGVNNFYMTGRFGGTLNLGSQTATDAGGGTTSFNAKFDKNGNFSWITSNYYQNGNNYVMGFARDKNNNSYCVGSAEGSHELILTKVNSAGTIMWAKEIASTIGVYNGDPTGLGAAVGDSGNVYVTGELRGSMTFGSTTITEAGGDDIYIAKFDSTGNSKWAVRYGDASFDEANTILLDKAGNIYICGSYAGSPTFGSFSAPPAVNGSNFFIAKLNSTAGAVDWLAIATSTAMPHGAWWPIQSMAIDSCNNLYVTGSFENTAQFGSNLSVTSLGNDDIFVAKCMSDGQWAWVKSAGSSIGSDRGAGIALDKDFDVYVVGDYQGTVQFGNQSITATANQDVFIAKYVNSTGDLQWVQTVSGTPGQNNGATGIAVDDQKFTYITGTYNSTANFGSHSIAEGGANIIFVAKLDTVPNLHIAVTPAPSYCPGSTANLAFSIIGTYNTGNNFTAQLSDSTGNFISPTVIGVNTNATTGGSISITIPQNTPAGANYIIRIVSSSPAYSSYDYCFRVSIGGGLNASVTPKDTTACSASPVQLQATGGSIYNWLPTTGLTCNTCANPIATPLANTTYVVNISSGGSCKAVSDTVIVNVNQSDSIKITPNNVAICSGDSIHLLATGSSIFKWSSGSTLTDSTIANPVAKPLISTTYTVTGSACTTASQAIVTVGNAAVGGHVTAVRDTICQGTSGNLVLSGNSSNQLQWQSSDVNTGSYVNIGTPASIDTIKYKTDPLIKSTWFRVLVGGGTCTAVSDSLQLVVPPSLTASFTSTTSGKTATFNSSGSIGNISNYFWDFGDGVTSTDSNPTHTYAKDTIYNPCLTIYDGSNCSYTFCRSIALGIPTISADGSWTIYPNPFNNELYIDRLTQAQNVHAIEMYDMLGRIVMNEPIINSRNSAFQLNVSELAKGMYYLMIKTTDNNYVQKLVKQ